MTDTALRIAQMIVPAVLTAIIAAMTHNHRKDNDRRETLEAERQTVQAERDILMFRALLASIALGRATAIALQNGKSNGETTKALKEADSATAALEDFLMTQGVKSTR